MTTRASSILAGPLAAFVGAALLLGGCDRTPDGGGAPAAAAPTSVAPAVPPLAEPVDLERADPLIQEAIRTTLAGANARPDADDALVLLGETAFANGYYELSAEAYERVLARAPNHASRRYVLAVALWRLDRRAEAIAALELVLERSDEFAAGHRRLAEWRLDQGDLDAAQAEIARALELDADAPGVRETAVRIDLQTGRIDDARDQVERLLGAERVSPYVHHLAVQVYRRLGDEDRLREHLELAEAPENLLWPDPWLDVIGERATGAVVNARRALGMLRARGAAAALGALEAEHARQPENVEITAGLVTAYIQLRRLDDAIRTADGAQGESPNLRKQQASALLFKASRDEAASAELAARARTAAERAVALAPTDADAHRLLGHACAAAGDEPAAIAAYEQAAEHDPAGGALYRGEIALVHLRAGRADEALAVMAPLVAADPGSVMLASVEAQALLAAGRPIDAIAAAERALQHHPDDGRAKRLVERVRAQATGAGRDG